MAPENRRLAKGLYYKVFRKGQDKDTDLCGELRLTAWASQGQPPEGSWERREIYNHTSDACLKSQHLLNKRELQDCSYLGYGLLGGGITGD